MLCAPAVLKVVKVLGCCTVLKSISKGDKDKDKDINKITKKKIKTIIRQRQTQRHEQWHLEAWVLRGRQCHALIRQAHQDQDDAVLR